MTRLFHSVAAVSIALVAAATLVAATGPVERSLRRPAASPYFGHWTVTDPAERFTARGRIYKTIDIAACGRDFCGVSVADNGACGVTLFRFLGRNANSEGLNGHGVWGRERKNIRLETWTTDDGREMELYLGDGHSLGSRSDSMPRFHAVYNQSGRARCIAR